MGREVSQPFRQLWQTNQPTDRLTDGRTDGLIGTFHQVICKGRFAPKKGLFEKEGGKRKKNIVSRVFLIQKQRQITRGKKRQTVSKRTILAPELRSDDMPAANRRSDEGAASVEDFEKVPFFF